MKLWWIIVSLIPVPFLFHFLEYNQRFVEGDSTLLLPAFIILILLTGFLAKSIKLHTLLFVNGVVAVLSILLAMNFIPNDTSWFKPLNRNQVMIFTIGLYIIGQLLVRWSVRALDNKKSENVSV